MYPQGYKPYGVITQVRIYKACDKIFVLLYSQTMNIFYGEDQGQFFSEDT